MPSGYREVETFGHLTERPARTGDRRRSLNVDMDGWGDLLTDPDETRRLQATTGLLRSVAAMAVRTLAEAELAGAVDESTASMRALFLTCFNRDRTAEDRLMAYEQLREALKRLDEIRDDMWDQAEGDREHLEHSADADAENAIDKLTGVRK